MQSKENIVLEQFYNSPRHWHFDKLLEKTGISRSQLSQWLKKLEKEQLIKRIKPRGKMPYYIQNYDNVNFRVKKRIFGLQKISSLLSHLASLSKAKVVILFGSFCRSDWHENSDIDIFIYGDDKELELNKYQSELQRDIQLFTAESKAHLRKMGSGLIQNIAEGFVVKGDLDQMGVKLHV